MIILVYTGDVKDGMLSLMSSIVIVISTVLLRAGSAPALLACTVRLTSVVISRSYERIVDFRVECYNSLLTNGCVFTSIPELLFMSIIANLVSSLAVKYNNNIILFLCYTLGTLTNNGELYCRVHSRSISIGSAQCQDFNIIGVLK